MATDYDTLLTDLEKYFCDLLIIQYRMSPKNRAFIKMLVDLVFANNLATKIAELTVNVEESTGAQLDVVGEWVGIDRYYVLDIITGTYFSLPKYINSRSGVYIQGQGGFSNYTNFDTLAGGFLTYEKWFKTISSASQMSDYWFRNLIKLKIIKNSLDFTNKNIDEAIYKWSNGEIYTTWGVKEVTYHYPTSWFETMNIAVAKDALPAPTGCKINILEYN